LHIYKLELLERAVIHPVFHVSLLKKKLGENVVTSTALPSVDGGGKVRITPVAIMDGKLMKQGRS
jgi:hypothetical protein